MGALGTEYRVYHCRGDQNNITVESLSKLFQNKTIVFIGDSTMREQTCMFACMLGFPSSIVPIAELSRDKVEISFQNVTIRSVPFGASFGTIKNLKNILEDEWGRNPSLIIINQGIHHNNIDRELLDKWNKESTLYNLTNIVADFYQEHIASQKNSHPRMLWRETTPQNHPTSNGVWVPRCHMSCKCVPLTVSMKLGKGIPKKCEPSCFPANGRNILTNGILEKTSIPIVRVYDALIDATFNIHKTDVDCTHLSVDSLLFINTAWIKLFL
jgi:hypothetical protein